VRFLGQICRKNCKTTVDAADHYCTIMILQ